MKSGVFDYAAVGQVYKERFVSNDPLAGSDLPARRDMSGTSRSHCAICPKLEGEECKDGCWDMRDRLKAEDGVTVT